MKNIEKNTKIVEFGDFQTPLELSLKVTEVLLRIGINPFTIVEPTCGLGSFIRASSSSFRSVKRILGFDINEQYIEIAKQINSDDKKNGTVSLSCANYFDYNWKELFDNIEYPLLVIGNPPWVTNSALGNINSLNLPKKTNFNGMNGFDAITGKSNFDISEWMIIKLIKTLTNKNAIIAMLCKTTVARKVFKYTVNENIGFNIFHIYNFDSQKYFNVNVDACLLVIKLGVSNRSADCEVFDSIDNTVPERRIGIRDNHLIADIGKYEKYSMLTGQSNYIWRSGLKHDCSNVMELHKFGDMFLNGFEKMITLEDTFLYPLYKSSDLNNKVKTPRVWTIVTQKRVGEDTAHIKNDAPLTWSYLTQYSDLLSSRTSSIYKNKPLFSIFGIGDYSFKNWKIAVSGFYKSLNFILLGPYDNKPAMLDDTCYFLSFTDEDEALNVLNILNSEPAREFYKSLIFWDEKRPITVSILEKLNIEKLIHFSYKNRPLVSRKTYSDIQESLQIL